MLHSSRRHLRHLLRLVRILTKAAIGLVRPARTRATRLLGLLAFALLGGRLLLLLAQNMLAELHLDLVVLVELHGGGQVAGCFLGLRGLLRAG